MRSATLAPSGLVMPGIALSSSDYDTKAECTFKCDSERAFPGDVLFMACRREANRCL